MKKVRKAVIAAAGMGTRFLPQTKAMPKEMLPIVDKPVIQLVVEGLVEAGIEDIVIVTGPTKRAIEDHFDRSLELEDALRKKDKGGRAEQLEAIGEMANFIYVRQKGEPVGNARPILNAAHIIGDEPFIYLFADDFFTGEKSVATQLIEAYNETNAKAVVALREVEKSEISSYGIADVASKVSDDIVKIKGLVEKPATEDAPSNLAVASGYLLTPDIFPILEKQEPSPRGEIEISDAVASLVDKGENVYGLIVRNAYHDTGNPEVYLQTVVNMALEDPNLGPGFAKFLQEKVRQLDKN